MKRPLLAVALLAVTGCSVLRTAAAVHSRAANLPQPPEPAASALPGTRFYLGVRAQGFPPSWASVERFSTAVGQPVKLVLIYSGWNEPFPSVLASEMRSHGVIPLIQINPSGTTMAGIASGREDSYLRSYAQAVRAFGGPVVIGFAHEMNGSWYPWGYGRTPPPVWVAAWRHVVHVFRQSRATNVTWLWTVSAGSTSPSRVRRYWPGAAYVNWVGIDGYYYKPTKRFAQIFAPSIRVIRSFTRDPIMLSETAIGPVAGQARMIPNLFAGIRRYHLRGLVWFDVAQHQGKYHQDWRLEGDPAGLAVFRRELKTVEPPG
jgi:mannan endo-1,4-beta-mannosidase